MHLQVTIIEDLRRNLTDTISLRFQLEAMEEQQRQSMETLAAMGRLEVMAPIHMAASSRSNHDMGQVGTVGLGGATARIP